MEHSSVSQEKLQIHAHTRLFANKLIDRVMGQFDLDSSIYAKVHTKWIEKLSLKLQNPSTPEVISVPDCVAPVIKRLKGLSGDPRNILHSKMKEINTLKLPRHESSFVLISKNREFEQSLSQLDLVSVAQHEHAVGTQRVYIQPEEDLILGMLIQIDMNKHQDRSITFIPGESLSSNLSSGRVIQVAKSKSKLAGIRQLIRVRLLNGQEVELEWPNNYSSIARKGSVLLDQIPSKTLASTLEDLNQQSQLYQPYLEINDARLNTNLVDNINSILDSLSVFGVDEDIVDSVSSIPKESFMLNYLEYPEQDVFPLNTTPNNFHANLVKLVTGERVSQETLDEVERYFERQAKRKRKIACIITTDEPADQASIQPDNALHPDDDPSIPTKMPQVTIISKVCKSSKVGSEWNLDFIDSYLQDNQRHIDLIIPKMKIKLDTHNYSFH